MGSRKVKEVNECFMTIQCVMKVQDTLGLISPDIQLHRHGVDKISREHSAHGPQ